MAEDEQVEEVEEKVIEIPTNRRNRRWYDRQKRRTHLKDSERKKTADGQLVPHPVPKCDWAGCENEWLFVTHATVGKKKTVQARRCGQHRLAQS